MSKSSFLSIISPVNAVGEYVLSLKISPYQEIHTHKAREKESGLSEGALLHK
jgi:hypothetical protein